MSIVEVDATRRWPVGGSNATTRLIPPQSSGMESLEIVLGQNISTGGNSTQQFTGHGYYNLMTGKTEASRSVKIDVSTINVPLSPKSDAAHLGHATEEPTTRLRLLQ